MNFSPTSTKKPSDILGILTLNPSHFPRTQEGSVTQSAAQGLARTVELQFGLQAGLLWTSTGGFVKKRGSPLVYRTYVLHRSLRIDFVPKGSLAKPEFQNLFVRGQNIVYIKKIQYSVDSCCSTVWWTALFTATAIFSWFSVYFMAVAFEPSLCRAQTSTFFFLCDYVSFGCIGFQCSSVYVHSE